MKRVLVGSIPHWEDAGVRLPIIAGGDHIPGHVGTSGTDASGEFLSQFSGQTIYTQDGQAFEVRSVKSGSITTYRLFPAGGGRQLSGSQMRGLTFVDNLGIGHTIGTVSGGDYPLQSRTMSESALARFFGVSDSGGSAPSFASTQAAQTQAEAFRRGERIGGQEFSSGQSDIDRDLQRQRDENAKRQNLIEIVSTLASRAGDLRQRTEADLMGLEQTALTLVSDRIGDDPIKGAILGSGLLQRGTTPNDALIARGQHAADTARGRLGDLQPVPRPDLTAGTAGLESQRDALLSQLDPQSTSDLEALLQPTNTLGLAQGGVVGESFDSLGAGGSPKGALTVNGRQVGQTGGVGFSVLVGEKGGFTGDEEVLNFDESGRLEDVRPLAGGAEHGASFDFDVDTLKQGLSSAFEETGFTETPVFGRLFKDGPLNILPGIGTSGEFATTGALGAAERLGSKPRLIHAGGTVYYVNPQGQLQPIPSMDVFNEAGFQMRDVVNVSQGELEAYGPRGPILQGAPPLIEPGVSQRRFPQNPTLRTIEFPDGQIIAIPEMRKLASLWRFLSGDTRKVISSALRFTDQSNEDQFRERRAFTPQGSALTAGATFG